ncbi:EcsC family protein [Methylocystis bryophila]|uniref:EcsC family protein n=1 Tax=Methylocystis bryophila TaxID=655015 RepID=UPI000A269EA4|nr:EcsC family protein [Methylocystis bryophila]BDV40569.1 peptidase [Methylocystis bryophila]
MSSLASKKEISAEDLADLRKAVRLLENQGFTRLLNNVAGKPAGKALEFVPRRLKNKIDKIVSGALKQGLQLALASLDGKDAAPPKKITSTLISSLAGGLSGFFGLAGLAAELPVTLTVMLRSIAEIARSQGEDLSLLPARLACMEVLALGAPVEEKHDQSSYYLARDEFSRFSGNAAEALSGRGVDAARSPEVNGFLGQVGAKFGVVVWERAAASSVPIIGVAGGAAGNALFIRYFQDLATGHFIVRKLERAYGEAIVRARFMDIFASLY